MRRLRNFGAAVHGSHQLIYFFAKIFYACATFLVIGSATLKRQWTPSHSYMDSVNG